MLTGTGAACLKLCRAESLKDILPLPHTSAAKLGNLTKTPSISLCFVHPAINSKTEWSDRSIPGNSLWSFCDSSVTLFKVKWPPTRRFKGHLASPGTSQSYLRLLPGLASCSLCSNESEPRKPKSGSPRILGNNVTSLYQLLQRRQAGLSSLTAFSRASPKTRSRNLSLVSIVSINIQHWQTRFYSSTWKKMWKHRWPKYLRLLSNGILKTVLHHADCPSAHLAVSPLLFVREDFGSRWK